jgi:hypothetical protein
MVQWGIEQAMAEQAQAPPFGSTLPPPPPSPIKPPHASHTCLVHVRHRVGRAHDSWPRRAVVRVELCGRGGRGAR